MLSTHRLSITTILFFVMAFSSCSPAKPSSVRLQDLFTHLQQDGLTVQDKVVSDEEKQMVQKMWRPIAAVSHALGADRHPSQNPLIENESKDVNDVLVRFENYRDEVVASETFKRDTQNEAMHRKERQQGPSDDDIIGFDRDYYLNGPIIMEIWHGDFVVENGESTRKYLSYDPMTLAKIVASFSSFKSN